MAVTETPKQAWSWKTGSPEKQANMDAFIEWALTPESERTPPSKAKLAQKLGVSENTLRNYQREPEFQRAVRERARMLARVDRLPAVLDALYAQATDPTNPRSVSAARELLIFMDKADPDKVAEGIDAEAMTQEELVKVALAILHKVESE